jgi:hypothetical protein
VQREAQHDLPPHGRSRHGIRCGFAHRRREEEGVGGDADKARGGVADESPVALVGRKLMRSFEELASDLDDNLDELIAQLAQASGRGDDSAETAEGLDLARRLKVWLADAEDDGGEGAGFNPPPLRYTCKLCGFEGEITGSRLDEYLATEMRPEITCEGCERKIILTPAPFTAAIEIH